MSTYVFRATATARMEACGAIEANSLQDARVEARAFLDEGNGDWDYEELDYDTIELCEVEQIHSVKPQNPQKPRDPQKSLRIKVRRAFDELANIEFVESFHDDLAFFYERLCRAKRPWKKELIEDAKTLLELAADRTGDCSLFNKGGQAYVALKAIKKCTL